MIPMGKSFYMVVLTKRFAINLNKQAKKKKELYL